MSVMLLRLANFVTELYHCLFVMLNVCFLGKIVSCALTAYNESYAIVYIIF